MIKIPLELYNSLLGEKNIPTKDSVSTNNPTNTQSGSERISKRPEISGGDDEKWLRYNQEYKRFQKLMKDQADRPMNVRIQNSSEFLDSVKNNAPNTAYSTASPDRTSPPPYHSQMFAGDLQSSDEEGEEGDEYSSAVEEEHRPQEDVPSTSHTHLKNKDKIIEYINENAKRLGVNAHDKLLHRFGGRLQPMKSSSVRRIVQYQLMYGHRHRRTRAIPSPPAGYKKFAQRAAQDPMLSKIFQNIVGTVRVHMGSGRRGFTINKTNTNSRKNFISFKKFKPLLWNLEAVN